MTQLSIRLPSSQASQLREADRRVKRAQHELRTIFQRKGKPALDWNIPYSIQTTDDFLDRLADGGSIL
jgi:hypothetical protein